MTSRHSSLSTEDIRAILSHLEASTAVLDKHSGEMTAVELSLKSMIGALKRELTAQLRSREKAND